MATRRRILLWIIVGLLLLPVVVIGGLATALWLRPFSRLPKSERVEAPTELSATLGRGHVTLRWREVPGAVSYQVFRAGRPQGEYANISQPYPGAPMLVQKLLDWLMPGGPFARVPHPPWVDTAVLPRRTYYYRVTAIDGDFATEPTAPLAVTVPSGEPGDGRVTIRVNAAREVGTLAHKWEVAIGSEHLSYMLKGDVNPNIRAAGQQLRQAHKRLRDEFGIQFVRAHGILMDDLGTYREAASGKPIYDWSGIDKVYDMLRADGLKPMVELSFMPAALASIPGKKGWLTNYYGGFISPPRDYAKWGALVEAFARHLIERYGREEVETWPFEVWNEPDFRTGWPGGFWTGSDEDYFRLYDYTAEALKKVSPKLRVGGPVAAASQIVEPFLKHVTTQSFATGGNSSSLDFLDVHIYFCPPLNWRPMLERYGLRNLPVYYTEWGVSPRFSDPANDNAYGAAWIARGLSESLDDVSMVSYWTGSDHFEEVGPPEASFHGGFGMLGLDGLRKPRYWAFHLLHQLGTRRLALEGDGDGFGGLVNGWATRAEDGSVRILLWNVTYDQTKASGSDTLGRQVSLEVAGLPGGNALRLNHFRVDNRHSNVYAAWQAMGQPDWPSPAQLAELHQKDGLEPLEPSRDLAADPQGKVRIEFDLPMPGLSLVELGPQGVSP